MPGKAVSLIDTRVIYCGDNFDQLRKVPEGCVDVIYIDPPLSSNRNYEVFWGDTKEKRFAEQHGRSAEIRRAEARYSLSLPLAFKPSATRYLFAPV